MLYLQTVEFYHPTHKKTKTALNNRAQKHYVNTFSYNHLILLYIQRMKNLKKAKDTLF